MSYCGSAWTGHNPRLARRKVNLYFIYNQASSFKSFYITMTTCGCFTPYELLVAYSKAEGKPQQINI
jgi:hypothetical protein